MWFYKKNFMIMYKFRDNDLLPFIRIKKYFLLFCDLRFRDVKILLV